MIFICCHYCCSLLWGNYWRPLIMWNSTSWRHLKLAIQKQLALHPFNAFLTNNCNMTGSKNIVKNYCSVALNVKLQVKLRFYWLLKPLYAAFTLGNHFQPLCSKFWHILPTSVQFTDRKWISKIFYYDVHLRATVRFTVI